jgi:hypothetical protein
MEHVDLVDLSEIVTTVVKNDNAIMHNLLSRAIRK